MLCFASRSFSQPSTRLYGRSNPALRAKVTEHELRAIAGRVGGRTQRSAARTIGRGSLHSASSASATGRMAASLVRPRTRSVRHGRRTAGGRARHRGNCRTSRDGAGRVRDRAGRTFVTLGLSYALERCLRGPLPAVCGHAPVPLTGRPGAVIDRELAPGRVRLESLHWATRTLCDGIWRCEAPDTRGASRRGLTKKRAEILTAECCAIAEHPKR